MPDAVQREIAILLVDDHALFRESVARLLAAEPGFRVVAHCESVDDALERLRQTPERVGKDSTARFWLLRLAWRKKKLRSSFAAASPESS